MWGATRRELGAYESNSIVSFWVNAVEPADAARIGSAFTDQLANELNAMSKDPAARQQLRQASCLRPRKESAAMAAPRECLRIYGLEAMSLIISA